MVLHLLDSLGVLLDDGLVVGDHAEMNVPLEKGVEMRTCLTESVMIGCADVLTQYRRDGRVDLIADLPHWRDGGEKRVCGISWLDKHNPCHRSVNRRECEMVSNPNRLGVWQDAQWLSHSEDDEKQIEPS